MNSNLNAEYILKFIIIGNSSVGKSSIMLRFINRYVPKVYEPTIGCSDQQSPHAMLERTEVHSTIGVGYGTRTIIVDGINIKLSVWDTAGQERYRSITYSYYRATSCAILVYDITDQKSFQSIPNWLNSVKTLTDNPAIVVVLVGNKSDLHDQRTVSYEEGNTFAKENNMLFFEASVKSGDTIDKIFTDATNSIIKNNISSRANANSGVKLIHKNQKQIEIKINNNNGDSGDNCHNRDNRKSDCC